jgi:hypothetical protein
VKSSVILAVVEFVLDAVADLKAVIGSYSNVAGIEKAVDV